MTSKFISYVLSTIFLVLLYVLLAIFLNFSVASLSLNTFIAKWGYIIGVFPTLFFVTEKFFYYNTKTKIIYILLSSGLPALILLFFWYNRA
jgi:hypothetical protein